jgi:predicted Zn-dependent peptidase
MKSPASRQKKMTRIKKVGAAMKAKTLFSLLFSAALVISAGCSTGSTKADEKPAQDQPAGDQQAQKVDERGIPELKPFTLAEEDAEVEKLGKVDGISAFKVGEVTVLHKETPANSVVAARVYISGGSANLTEATAGLERLALNTAVSGGTESHSKDEFNAILDSMGSSVSTFTDRDFSGYAMKSVVDNFETTWDLMLGSIVEPTLPEDELVLQRERHLADIRSLRENPDRLMGYIGTKLMFQGHPYYTLQLGTEENVEAFTRDQVVAYQHALLQPERMTVVVVGNVPEAEIASKVQRLAKIQPNMSLEQQELTEFDADAPEIAIEEKEIPTNYIFGLFAAPSPGEEDYEAMLVAVEYLRDRLFEEVRTKRNLTYAVSAGLADARTNYGYLYVTAVDPDTTMPVIYDEVEKLKQGKVTADQLEQSRNVFITEHYMDLETNGSQASLLARSELIANDWKSQANAIERFKAVTPEDVQRVADKYMKNYHFGIVGNEAEINNELFAR